MAQTWQEDLLLLHALGWDGDLIDGACEALNQACRDRALQGRALLGLSRREVEDVLQQGVNEQESGALLRVAEVHDRLDREGNELRRALYNLNAFVESLRGR
jgi:hypothetical protein